MANPIRFHEQFGSGDHETISSERSFGFVFACVFTSLGGWQAWNGSLWCLASFAMALVILTIALTKPGILYVPNLLWARLGLILARIVNPLVMLVLYAVIFTPVATFRKLMGADPLRLKPLPEKESYWIKRTPPGPQPSDMSRQY